MKTWQWIITAAIAAYGALLTTYNIVRGRRQGKHQITVTVTYGLLTYGPQNDLGDEQMMFITASNPGNRALTLTSAGVRLPDGRQIVLTSSEGTVQLPHHLTEGTSCKQWIPLAEVERQLRRLGFSGKVSVRGFYLDAFDKHHLSEPVEIDLNHPS